MPLGTAERRMKSIRGSTRAAQSQSSPGLLLQLGRPEPSSPSAPSEEAPTSWLPPKIKGTAMGPYRSIAEIERACIRAWGDPLTAEGFGAHRYEPFERVYAGRYFIDALWSEPGSDPDYGVWAVGNSGSLYSVQNTGPTGDFLSFEIAEDALIGGLASGGLELRQIPTVLEGWDVDEEVSLSRAREIGSLIANGLSSPELIQEARKWPFADQDHEQWNWHLFLGDLGVGYPHPRSKSKGIIDDLSD